MTCDCDTDHCEHWATREARFIARTANLDPLPPVKYCVGCFRRLSDCTCVDDDEHDENMIATYGPL